MVSFKIALHCTPLMAYNGRRRRPTGSHNYSNGGVLLVLLLLLLQQVSGSPSPDKCNYNSRSQEDSELLVSFSKILKQLQPLEDLFDIVCSGDKDAWATVQKELVAVSHLARSLRERIPHKTNGAENPSGKKKAKGADNQPGRQSIIQGSPIQVGASSNVKPKPVSLGNLTPFGAAVGIGASGKTPQVSALMCQTLTPKINLQYISVLRSEGLLLSVKAGIEGCTETVQKQVETNLDCSCTPPITTAPVIINGTTLSTEVTPPSIISTITASTPVNATTATEGTTVSGETTATTEVSGGYTAPPTSSEVTPSTITATTPVNATTASTTTTTTGSTITPPGPITPFRPPYGNYTGPTTTTTEGKTATDVTTPTGTPSIIITTTKGSTETSITTTPIISITTTPIDIVYSEPTETTVTGSTTTPSEISTETGITTTPTKEPEINGTATKTTTPRVPYTGSTTTTTEGTTVSVTTLNGTVTTSVENITTSVTATTTEVTTLNVTVTTSTGTTSNETCVTASANITAEITKLNDQMNEIQNKINGVTQALIECAQDKDALEKAQILTQTLRELIQRLQGVLDRLSTLQGQPQARLIPTFLRNFNVPSLRGVYVGEGEVHCAKDDSSFTESFAAVDTALGYLAAHPTNSSVADQLYCSASHMVDTASQVMQAPQVRQGTLYEEVNLATTTNANIDHVLQVVAKEEEENENRRKKLEIELKDLNAQSKDIEQKLIEAKKELQHENIEA